MTVQELASVVEELVELLHLQAKELEKLIAHVEQVTAHLPEVSEMSVVRSSLSGLHLRLKKLQARGDPRAAEMPDPRSKPGARFPTESMDPQC